MDVLVVIDMQNDFIDGVFGTKEAQEIVPKVVNFIKNFKGKVYCTIDEHHDFDNNNILYKNIETTTLPKHCISGTEGIELNSEIKQVLYSRETYPTIYHKSNFGSIYAMQNIDLQDDNDIFYICGLCTDICVISNALVLRAINNKRKIIILSDLCAGTTPENHNKALDIMKMNLIEIKESNEVLNK